MNWRKNRGNCLQVIVYLPENVRCRRHWKNLTRNATSLRPTRYPLATRGLLRHNNAMSASSFPSTLGEQFSTSASVADRLAATARMLPGRLAVVAARSGRGHRPKHERYHSIRYAELDQRATNIARGLIEIGVKRETRIALLVRPGIDFVALVFGLLRSGATMVLVDAGLGRKNLVGCLAATKPEGFVGIPAAHVLRWFYRRRFMQARLNVTVGGRWGWGNKTIRRLEDRGAVSSVELPTCEADDSAAIVFTSGSTGPPKGVEYRHQTFAAQLAEIERMYDLKPGGVDLACFPLFGLFNVALGITTVLPEMDFSRPASCDPAKLLTAANDWEVTQSFASPAVWDRVSRYCQQHKLSMPTLREVFSCGAPVSSEVIKRTLAHVHPEARMHTPYGATECLPISTVEASELIGDAAETTANGGGVCVGRRVDSIDWRVIAITDEPIAVDCSHARQNVDESPPGHPPSGDGGYILHELPMGQIGELIVRGPQVSQRYVAIGADEANRMAKIVDGDTIWHRTGDVGYFDTHGRFWYCGRKSQRVVLDEQTLYTECVEGIFNSHAAVHKSALVPVAVDGKTPAAIVIQPELAHGTASIDAELREFARHHECVRAVSHLFVHKQLPVDIRHNSKIRREELARWVQQQVNR
jgi:olefin beta-lactone synthetase